MSRAGNGAATNESPPARSPHPAPPRPLVARRGVVVPLTPEQWLGVGLLGNMRQVGQLWAAHEEATGGDPDDATDNHTLGVAGELGAHLSLNLRWTSFSTRCRHWPDVGRRIEVRATDWPDGCLIIQPRDRPDRPFVLALIEPPHVRLAGWMLGREAKVDRWKRTNRNGAPVWYVPQWALREYDPAVLRWLDAAP